jgi:hypothetical protein
VHRIKNKDNTKHEDNLERKQNKTWKKAFIPYENFVMPPLHPTGPSFVFITLTII